MTSEAEILMDGRIPSPVQLLLYSYLEGLDRDLPGRVCGLYLHGSAAAGDFNERVSDVDLIAVLNGVLDENEVDHLATLHHQIQVKFPQNRLEVNYLQFSDLGRAKRDIPPGPYHNGSHLLRMERAHVSPITWWNLKHSALTLRGPDSEDLPYEVTWPDLAEWIQRSLNSYWLNWTHNPRNLFSLMKENVVAWSVLGICRMYYSFREHNIVSKEKAGEYVLSQMPERARIVREALRIRAGTGNLDYRCRVSRALSALRFINAMVLECRKIVERQGG